MLEVVSADGTAAEIVIWNPDGSVAEFSGNGGRSGGLARWASGGRAGVAVSSGGRSYPARVPRGRHDRDGGRRRRSGEIERHRRRGSAIELTGVSVGNPHAVVRARAERESCSGSDLRSETADPFPERTNVQLVQVDGAHEVTALVWERGAGRASGSSAVAVASAAIANGWCEPGRVHHAGGRVGCELDEENGCSSGRPRRSAKVS